MFKKRTGVVAMKRLKAVPGVWVHGEQDVKS